MRGRLSASSPLLLLLAGLFVLGGCSSNSFVGRRYDNFTAYYNTFYNAKEAYRSGVESLEANDVPIDRDVYLPIFSTPDRAGNTVEFDNAIQKSADVLREHDASKWADDALLLIGKSYFYLRNYVGAEQKFREVIGLDGRFEDSPLKDEARFWLARTLIASEAYEEAAQHLQETLLGEELPRRWEGRLRLALAELYVKQGAWEEAAAELETGLDLVKSDELGARAQFLYGQVQETLGHYEAAAEAFRQVRRYGPLFELAYAAQMSAIRLEGTHGDAEAALDQLRRMERDDKFYERRAELAYLRGRIYQAVGRAREARDLYHELLYDNDAGLQEVRGRVHYSLGALYRDAYNDYFLAAAHFDTAGTALGPQQRRSGGFGGSGGTMGPLAFTAEAVTDASDQALVFGSFAEAAAEVNRMDSLLHLGGLDEAAFEEAILGIRRQRAEELAEQQRELARRQARQRFSGEGFDADERFEDEFDDPLVEDFEEDGAASAASTTAGFLFHRSPVKVQEGRLLFLDVWGERPLVPNWRRAEAISGEAASVYSTSDNLAQLTQRGTLPDVEENLLPDVDLSDVPRDVVARQAMVADRARARYGLANVLFLQMNRPDSAAAWYRMVIEEDADQPVAQRAYYALAEVQQALGDTASAERIYRQMLEDYPASDFAGRIRQRLGLTTDAGAAPDSAKLAEDAYREAFRWWERGGYQRALTGMLDVAARYRQTPVAPKALTAAGSIYAEWARRDSLDLFAALPLSVPDSLLQEAGLLEAVRAAASTDTAGAATPLLTLGIVPATVQDGPPSDSAPDVQANTTDVQANAPDAQPRETTPLHLETLYASIARNYPQSPYAERAQQVLATIRELRLASGPDSAAAPSGVAEDTLPAASPGVAGGAPPVDTARSQVDGETYEDPKQAALRRARENEGRPDPTPEDRVLEEQRRMRRERAPSAPVADALSPEEAASMRVLPVSETPVDLDKGGWTLVIASGSDRAIAEVALNTHGERLGQQGFQMGILVTDQGETRRYRAVLGQFHAEADARSAFQYFGRELPEGTRLLRLDAAPEAEAGAARGLDTFPPEAQTSEAIPVASTIDPARGGWSIVVASDPDSTGVAATLASYEAALRRQGLPTGIVASEADGTVRYRALTGQFDARAAAQAALDGLAGELPEDAWLLRLRPGR